jgi:hypothetical protein
MILSGIQQAADGAVGIIQVSKRHAVRGADTHTGWIETLLNAVHAKRALVDVSLGMNEPGIVGTCGNARFASDAQVLLHQHNLSEFLHVARAGGTAVDARRVVTMIASLAADFHVNRGKLSVCIVHNPIPVEPFGHVVFRFAGHNAIHASDAFRCVDGHSEPCHG